MKLAQIFAMLVYVALFEICIFLRLHLATADWNNHSATTNIPPSKKDKEIVLNKHVKKDFGIHT